MSNRGGPARRRRLLPLMSTLVLAACSGATPGATSQDVPDGTVPLSVLAFTSSAPGWNASIPAFGDTEGGAGISVQTTFGPSGELTKAILDGADADVVYLADQPNMNRLVLEEKLPADWNTGEYQGRPFHTISTLVVREGNPLNIQNWSDLLRPGVEVIAPNPVLSGSGKWGLMAAYASASDGGRDDEAGIDFLHKLILEHVRVGPTTVSEAVDLFLAGTGDVLLAPENSAIDAQRHSTVQRVVPPRTLEIDNQAAVLSTSEHQDEATRLVEFLYTPQAQRLWAEAGFRPTLPEVAEEFAADFPIPQTLWTISDIGGWNTLDARFYDPENGIITVLFDQATT